MSDKQWVYIIRHGDRWDYENPQWLETTDRRGDPPLSSLGHRQARETGQLLYETIVKEHGIKLQDITWISSPFLRCLQTSNDAIDNITLAEQQQQQQSNSTTTNTNTRKHLQILPENGIFEWDGRGGTWHASLPPLNERRHYFPRLVTTHESLYNPPLPEAKNDLLPRCQHFWKALTQKYPNKPAIVLVTHAAVCIGLASVAANLPIDAVTPAAPCSVFRLSKQLNDNEWTMDAHDASGSFNGYTSHLTHMPGSTIPWNHFGDNKSYTGPKTSRFAPKNILEETGQEADD